MDKQLRKQLLCGVATVAITVAVNGTALAAPQGVFNWTGFYIGGHVGWGQADFHTLPHDGATGQNNNKPSGFVGGVHVGQNWQNNTFVSGWEADLSATGLSKGSSKGFGTDGRFINNSVNLLASLRARLGTTFDRTLLYVTGGLAYTNAKYFAGSPGSTRWSGKYGKFGWVAGLGAEWKTNPTVTWRLEALYYGFDNTKHFGTDSHDPIWRSTFRDAIVVRLGASIPY